MLCPPQSPSRLVEDWIDRHRNPTSFALHILGIPPTILGVMLIPVYIWLLSVPVFLLALSLFVGGYLLQFLGHFLEGSMPGELAWMLRKLGRTYGRVAPAAESQHGLA